MQLRKEVVDCELFALLTSDSGLPPATGRQHERSQPQSTGILVCLRICLWSVLLVYRNLWGNGVLTNCWLYLIIVELWLFCSEKKFCDVLRVWYWHLICLISRICPYGSRFDKFAMMLSGYKWLIKQLRFNKTWMFSQKMTFRLLAFFCKELPNETVHSTSMNSSCAHDKDRPSNWFVLVALFH